jgi:hypothetical protein
MDDPFNDVKEYRPLDYQIINTLEMYYAKLHYSETYLSPIIGFEALPQTLRRLRN